MELKNLNQAICEFVKNEVEYIQSYVNNKDNVESKMFYNGYTFYGKDYKGGKEYNQIIGLNGIYIIYMNENLFLSDKMVFDFNESAKGGKFKEYKSYDLKKGTCIYLGSCVSESLFTRINQHFKDNSNFGSLHLMNEKRKIIKDKIKIVAFPIKYSALECSNILLKKIEEELHRNLNPTNGSSRI